MRIRDDRSGKLPEAIDLIDALYVVANHRVLPMDLRMAASESLARLGYPASKELNMAEAARGDIDQQHLEDNLASITRDWPATAPLCAQLAERAHHGVLNEADHKCLDELQQLVDQRSMLLGEAKL